MKSLEALQAVVTFLLPIPTLGSCLFQGPRLAPQTLPGALVEGDVAAPWQKGDERSRGEVKEERKNKQEWTNFNL